MRRPRFSADESGAAALEFVLVGLVLLVPLFYLVIVLGHIQSHSLGAEAASRHLARVIATASDSERPQQVLKVVGAIEKEYGMRGGALDVSVSCIPAADTCPYAGAIVRVTVRISVRLPLVPEVFGLDRIARVHVEAEGVQQVRRSATDAGGTGQ